MKTRFLTRIVLFVATNLAVLVVLAVVLRLLGVDRILDAQGVGLDYRSLLIMSAVIGFGGSFISLAMSKWIAKRAMGAQVIAQPRTEVETWLVGTVRRLAAEAGIGMPEVAVYASDDMNAFATGARRNHALVAVSTGLLQRMRREEVEAVLAHEVAHVANGDMVTLALLQGVVNTFVIFLSRIIGHVVDRVVFRTERGHGPGFWITAIVAQLVLGVLATVIVLWYSRRREFRADNGSARLRGARPMIAALERLSGARGPAALPDSLKAFGIRGPNRTGLARLFMSHPPVEERIAALQNLG
ncbi:MAG: protease HtpX [Candidatus Rokubacteria bacterium]|nr:protease HtpX [Candidatus Rokubacteria bacterium]